MSTQITPVQNEKEIVEYNEQRGDLGDVEENKPKYAANTQMDDAARLLYEVGGHVEYTKEEEKRVLRKVDFYVCIPMCLVYWIQ